MAEELTIANVQTADPPDDRAGRIADAAESEMKTDAAPEEDAPEEDAAEGPQPETQEEELAEVPVIVQNHAPWMAKVWDQLSDEQHQIALDGLAEQIQTGEPATEPERPQTKTEAAEPPQRGPERTVGAEPTNLPVLPEAPPAIGAEEIAEALEDVAAPADGPLATVLTKLLAHAQFATATATRLSLLNAGALEEVQTQIGTLADERRLGDALEAHAPEMRGMNDAQQGSIATAAVEIKRKGRVKTWPDAVSLALHEARRNPAKAKPPNADAARVAASLMGGKGGRKLRRPQIRQGASIREIAQALDPRVLDTY